MAITLLDQETQIRNTAPVALYGDGVAPSEANFETSATTLLDDLNNIRSQLSNLMDNQAGDWFTDLNTPSALDAGSQRGVNDLNTDLHAIERKRVLVARKLLVDIATGAGDAVVILGSGELPTETTAAVGAVTTEGTIVAAHGGTFGTHSLTEVAGAHALAPKNLCEITDASGDPILSSGRRVWALLHGESGLTDGVTITDTTTTRVQLSFVRPNSAHTDLEIVPFADIENTNVRYCYMERIAFDDMTEQDWASGGASIDIGAGAGTVTRQVAYDNQGTGTVDLTTNATLDLAASLTWEMRDVGDNVIFSAHEGDSGSDGIFTIGAGADTFDCDAAANDFLQGASFDTGGTTINVGVTAAQIDAGAAMAVKTTAGVLTVESAADLILNDGNMIGEGTWTGPGVKVSDTAGEVTAYEAAFAGEVSLMNAIVQAKNSAHYRRVFSVCTTAAAADADVSGPSDDNNLDADLGDISGGTFVDDYDVYLNGQYQRLGATAGANFDVYPGTALASGQLKFEKKVKVGDTIAIVDRVA